MQISNKQLGSIFLAIALLTTGGVFVAESVAAEGLTRVGVQAEKSIVETAAGAESFSTLVAAVKAAQLVDVLQGDGPFTVFAPTNEAFAKLPKKTLQDLLRPENRATLQGILTYHVVPGRVELKDALSLRSATTVNGQRVEFMRKGTGLTIDGARIVKGDIACRNGVIHVIDSVILPSSTSIAAIAQKDHRFSTLLAAVKAAGLADTLAGDGNFTVFAPTNEAFAKLPKGTVEKLLKPENRAELVRVLTYHVLGSRVFLEDAVKEGSASTLAKAPVEIGFGERGVEIGSGGATIAASDIDASNGVVHVIDQVLLPPGLDLGSQRKVIGIHYRQPDAHVREALGLRHGEGMVVTRLVDGYGAMAAGLRPEDVIVSVNGLPATVENLAAEKAKCATDGEVELMIVRVVPVGVRPE